MICYAIANNEIIEFKIDDGKLVYVDKKQSITFGCDGKYVITSTNPLLKDQYDLPSDTNWVLPEKFALANNFFPVVADASREVFSESVAFEVSNSNIDLWELVIPLGLDVTFLEMSTKSFFSIPENWTLGFLDLRNKICACPSYLVKKFDLLYLALEGNQGAVDRIFNHYINSKINKGSSPLSSSFSNIIAPKGSANAGNCYEKVTGILLGDTFAKISSSETVYPYEIEDYEPSCFLVGKDWYISLRKALRFNKEKGYFYSRECSIGPLLIAAMGKDFYSFLDYSVFPNEYFESIADKSDTLLADETKRANPIIVNGIKQESGQKKFISGELMAMIYEKDRTRALIVNGSEILKVPLMDLSPFMEKIPQDWIVLSLCHRNSKKEVLIVGGVSVIEELLSSSTCNNIY